MCAQWAMTDTNEGLVARAVAGDADAFSALVAEFGPDVLRLCAVITADRGLAEDAAQNAWRQAWLRLSTVKSPASVRAWLLRVAANEAKQVLRRRRRRPESSLEQTDPIRARGGDPQDFAALRDALRMLRASEREVLAYHYVLGFSAEEIGARLGQLNEAPMLFQGILRSCSSGPAATNAKPSREARHPPNDNEIPRAFTVAPPRGLASSADGAFRISQSCVAFPAL